MDLLQLNELAREVLLHLPGAPNGLSAMELADGLLNDRSPSGVGRILAALRQIETVVGALAVRKGDDAFGRCAVAMFGLPREAMIHARRLAACLSRQQSVGNPAGEGRGLSSPPDGGDCCKTPLPV